MTKRGRGAPGSPLVGALLLALIALAVGAAWFLRGGRMPALPAPPASGTAMPAAGTREPAARGRAVGVSGTPHAGRAARDGQLGVEAGADAIALLRRVEMAQWRERCTGARCEYAIEWSERPIDSSAFRERRGHENPPRLPFPSARFLADDVRLGAYRLDAALVAKIAAAAEPRAWPVHADRLPPNLAATFRERDGALYAGGDPAHPAAGDLRVSYRVVAGDLHARGVPQGDRLGPSPD